MTTSTAFHRSCNRDPHTVCIRWLESHLSHSLCTRRSIVKTNKSTQKLTLSFDRHTLSHITKSKNRFSGFRSSSLSFHKCFSHYLVFRMARQPLPNRPSAGGERNHHTARPVQFLRYQAASYGCSYGSGYVYAERAAETTHVNVNTENNSFRGPNYFFAIPTNKQTHRFASIFNDLEIIS